LSPTAQGIRYVHLVDSARIGGAEKLAIDILTFLAGSGSGVASLLCPASSETGTIARSHGIAVSPYPAQWLLAPQPARCLSANAVVLGRLGGRRPTLLHLHSPFVFLALRPAIRLSRARTVLHMHLDYSDELLSKVLARPPHLIVACGEFIRRRLAQVQQKQSNRQATIATIRNAVDTKTFQPGDRESAKARLGVDPQRPLLLMVANLAAHKGQSTAIKAVGSLAAEGLRPSLWLVGEERDSSSNYTAQLRSLVERLGVSDHVQFTGFREDVPDLLRASDFLLLPSTAEGLPLVILEAQASNTVVLAAPTAGVPEVITDGETGFLIAAEDHQGYASILGRLIRRPDEARAVAQNALAQVHSGFTFERYCEILMAEYDKLMQSED
jgi:glycosyltransferase involved in cell wall biosynthesis